MNETMKFLQSASNAVAGNVSGPVDLISMALAKLGIPVGNAPVGGSAWMKHRGLMADVPQGAAQVAGDTFGMLAPMMAVAKAPQIAKGLLQAGDNLAAPRTLNPQAGVINWPGAPKAVYHGTGKNFDSFDRSKLTSNTNADDAAIGWHFSDNKSDAGFYADMAARKSGLEKGYIGQWDLDIKSPLVIGLDEADGNVPAGFIEKLLKNKFLAKEYALSKGHDGIIYPYGTDVDSAWTAILFDGGKAKQIK